MRITVIMLNTRSELNRLGRSLGLGQGGEMRVYVHERLSTAPTTPTKQEGHNGLIHPHDLPYCWCAMLYCAIGYYCLGHLGIWDELRVCLVSHADWIVGHTVYWLTH